mgnify:CR=1 FL=1|jgi:hypothetical protein
MTSLLLELLAGAFCVLSFTVLALCALAPIFLDKD